MNDLQHDPELSLEQRALASDLRERSLYQAEQDYQGFKELKKSVAFQKVFLRRLKEKREAIEKSVIDGVKPELYSYCVDRIALLREIGEMAETERIICWKTINPGKVEIQD